MTRHEPPIDAAAGEAAPRPGVDLSGKVAVVTGASKRLGRCYALALARAGARVHALARTLGDDPHAYGSLREVEHAARVDGLDLAVHACDLGEEAALRATIEAIGDEAGFIDCIVNNAVASKERLASATIGREDWDRAFHTNLRAPYLMIDAALPYLRRRGGSVINVTSLAAGRTGKGGGAHQGLLLYGLTKAALNRLTTWYAAELADGGIAVNAISPGDVSVYLRQVNGLGEAAGDEDVVAGVQLDEAFWGDPVVWLAGQPPSRVTGEILHTYAFGETWGPKADGPRRLSPALRGILARDNVRTPDRDGADRHPA